MTARKLLLLDGHSLAYRAFFALPTDLATAAGTVTNAVYGFTSMLTKVLTDEQPDLVAVAFDTPGRTFRDDMDSEYKAGRSAAPDLFKSQLPLIREVLDTLDITMIEEPGVEADDVIATLAVQAADKGVDVIIVTGDRDSYQLVRDPHIKVLYNRRGVSDYALYDEAGIFERTGVTPAQYPEYAALRGDPSDNLPGVPGIGEKTASKLVATYGTLEAIFEHLDELPPRQRQNLGAAQERVLKNRAMSILRRDVPLEVGFDDFTMHAIDREKLRVLFNQLEFRTLLPRILEALGAAEPDAEPIDAVGFEVDVRTIRDAGEAVAAFDELAGHSGRVALEARWAGVPGRSALLGLAAARATDAAVYFDAPTLETPAVREALARLVGAAGEPPERTGRSAARPTRGLRRQGGRPWEPDPTSTGPPLVVHRAKELTHGLHELDLRALESDTAIMAYLLDPAEGKYLLDDLALRYLSIELRSPDAVEGTLDFDGDQESNRTGRQAAALLLLVDRLREALDARELTALYERFERPLVRVLARMEHAGVAVDLAFLEELSAELGSQCRELEAKIHAHAGETFNVNSTPQVRRILFDVLGLTPVKRTKTGPSTDADSLQKMAETHPIVADLLKYREVEKLRGTYADALPPLVGPDGRIHASFNQISTTTGRISSDSPNLQNIPVRTSGGREMRKAFVAAEGFGLLTADYSQIELRVLAHLAEDPGLIDAFARNLDVHTVTAARVFDVDEKKVDEFQRRFAKVVNYGLAYGMEAYGLGQRLDIPTDQAREILDAYFDSFPNVHTYMEESVREAKSRGYTTTIFGRRRLLPELASDNFRIRQMGERMAQNAPVQGSAADIFKLAMIDVDDALIAAGSESRMILTVHDEIVLEVPVAEEQSVRELVRTTMEGVCELKVPLVVDLGFGPNWAAAK